MSVEILRRGPTEFHVVDVESGRTLSIEKSYGAALKAHSCGQKQRDAVNSLHGGLNPNDGFQLRDPRGKPRGETHRKR